MGTLNMISGARFLGLATVGTALAMAAAAPETATAQGAAACKGETLTVTGKATFRPLSKSKELEGKGAAMADAVASWERQVAKRFGQPWKQWAAAKDTSFDCGPQDGKIVGTSLIACTISGRPCAAASAAAAAPAAGRDKKGRGDAAARAPQPPVQPPPDSPTTSRWGPDYDREMARQEKLAEERRKAEAAEYEREMAQQEKLAGDRWKGEYRNEQGRPAGRR
jgi:hypothetical protein